MRRRIYIAGPISRGDLARNIQRAEAAFFALLRAGFAPLCPHWSVYSTGPVRGLVPTGQCGLRERIYAEAKAQGGGNCTHADWLGADLPWVEVAHAVLRLPGESVGADAEVAHAERQGIPVYESLAELILCESPQPTNTGA
jgi:hypothetical protein